MSTYKSCDIEILPFTIEDVESVFEEREVEVIFTETYRVKPLSNQVILQTSSVTFDFSKLEVTRIKPST